MSIEMRGVFLYLLFDSVRGNFAVFPTLYALEGKSNDKAFGEVWVKENTISLRLSASKDNLKGKSQGISFCI